MARSPYCEKARQEAKPHDQVSQQLIALLDRPIAGHEEEKLQQRLSELVALFGSLDKGQASRLLARLGNPRDPLARFFDCELHHRTRNNLRETLRKRLQENGRRRSSEVNELDRAIHNRATDNNGVEPVLPPRPPDSTRPPPPGPSKIALPIIDGTPKDIIDRAKKIVEGLKQFNGDSQLIERLERLLSKAMPIVGIAAAILGLYVFVKGRLVQTLVAKELFQQRILHRFIVSGMEEQLERILRELTAPEMTREVEEELRRVQGRGTAGQFEQKGPGKAAAQPKALEKTVPGETGRIAERVWSNVLATPRNPRSANGGRFNTPYANVEPDFIPAVSPSGEVVFGRELTYANAHGVPSVHDALLVADSKYLGVLSDNVRTIRFSTLGKKTADQVRGMIWLSKFTKSRTFVFLVRSGQTLGTDILEFAKSVGVEVSSQTHALVK